ncbi:unnamed protein product, partial [Ectocarpus sp. 8 AP-2014]
FVAVLLLRPSVLVLVFVVVKLPILYWWHCQGKTRRLARQRHGGTVETGVRGRYGTDLSEYPLVRLMRLVVWSAGLQVEYKPEYRYQWPERVYFLPTVRCCCYSLAIEGLERLTDKTEGRKQ